MRTSREWIDQTIAGLDEPATLADAPAASATTPARLTLELELSAEERRVLDEICAQDELSPVQALTQILRSRLLGRPQFGRADRARLRSCLELLRALEQHVGRAARPAKGRGQTAEVISARTNELLELGDYLRRVGRAIGEAMAGNLQYWQGEARPQSAPPPEATPARAGQRPPARTPAA
jgi:hypothetical protein